MVKRILIIFIFLTLIIHPSRAQDSTTINSFSTYRVGFFAPIHLDSVFTGTYYRYGKNFPKFSFPGLEFFQGAMVALDSMLVYRANIDARFFDTRSVDMENALKRKEFDSLDLVIGSVREPDFTILANFAKQRNVPFISATYPNDGGMTNNPFLVIMNSTLRAHCEAIYSYVLQSHGMDNIILATQPGSQEEKVAAYLKGSNQPDGQSLLKYKVANLESGVDAIIKSLDSTKKNVIIGGSLDEVFATDLARTSAGLRKSYDIKLIGMPNWDAFFNKPNPKLKDFPVYFTTPYYNGKEDNYSLMLMDVYKEKYKISPSDLAFKGFEAVYLFVKLLAKHPHDFISHLNDYPHKVFSDYNFKPVFLGNSSSPDYFENKHLYILKMENGEVTDSF